MSDEVREAKAGEAATVTKTRNSRLKKKNRSRNQLQK